MVSAGGRALHSRKAGHIRQISHRIQRKRGHSNFSACAKLGNTMRKGLELMCAPHAGIGSIEDQKTKNCREISRRLSIPPQTIQNWALHDVKPMLVKTYNDAWSL